MLLFTLTEMLTLILFTLILGPLSLLILLTVWYKRADADLSLLYAEKYGIKPKEAFSKKVVWIIGSASGIGEQLAYTLVRCGAKLVLSDKNCDELQRVRNACLEMGTVEDKEILSLPMDITEFELHQKCVDDVIKHFGKIDVVFHNAGCSQRAVLHEIKTEVDKELFDINCFGHVSLARKIIPHFLTAGGGHFVATSSALGLMGFPGGATYVGSKYAIRGFFESIRAEYVTSGINVTTIFPGAVFSKIFDNFFTDSPGKFVNAPMKPTDNRMKTSRCAELMAIAVANRLEEAWPSRQPFLTLMYLAQYTPVFFKRVVTKKVFLPGNADAIRNGRMF